MLHIRPLSAPMARLSNMLAIRSEAPGVLVADRVNLGLASVLARRGKENALGQRVHERFGAALPEGPLRRTAGDLAFIGTGPLAWLVTRVRGGNAFAASLKEALGDLAAIADQSDGYTVLRLHGLNVRETLAKMVPVDLHPRAFDVGAVAATTAAHIGVMLWRIEDTSDAMAVFEMAIPLSSSGSFAHLLSHSAAQFGLVIGTPEE